MLGFFLKNYLHISKIFCTFADAKVKTYHKEMKAKLLLQKRTNAISGKKAHNESQFIKIGRVRLHSWINEKLPAADIIISEREIVHIANKHHQELALLGMEAFNYVTMIINQSNEVRKDDRDAFFFVVSGARKTDSDLEQCAVVELKIEWMGKKKVYVIKSARPMNWGRLRKIELVCVKPRS